MKRSSLHFDIMAIFVIALIAAILTISGCAQQAQQQQQQKKQEQQTEQTVESTAGASTTGGTKQPASEGSQEPETGAEQPAQMPPRQSEEDLYKDNLDQALEDLNQLE